MDDDTPSRRQDDILMGKILSHMEADKEWKKGFEERYQADQIRHSETHGKLYGEISGTKIKMALFTGGVLAAWEAIKSGVGGK